MKTCCGMNGAPNYPAGCAAVCVAGTCASDEEVRATDETTTSSRFHTSQFFFSSIILSPFFFSEGRSVRNFPGGCEGRKSRGLVQRKFVHVLQPCWFPLRSDPRSLLPRWILRQRRGGTCYFPTVRNLISRPTSSTVRASPSRLRSLTSFWRRWKTASSRYVQRVKVVPCLIVNVLTRVFSY